MIDIQELIVQIVLIELMSLWLGLVSVILNRLKTLLVDSRVKIKEKILTLGKQFKKNLINIWVELGNRISMLYCGTQSVANHMTKKQNNSLLSFLSGGIKSINRFYNANIGDNFKHQCIQHFLHKKKLLSSTYYFSDNISSKVLNQLKYCSYEQLKIYIVTWNCNQVDPFKLNNKQKQQLFNFMNEDINFIVFNLQQIVQLSSYNVLLGNNQSIVSDWAKVILKCLNDKEINQINTCTRKQFYLLTSHDLVGLATFVFCSNKIQNKISAYQWLDIKTGFKGNSGHKGAIMLFIQIDSSWITFINCHLASGQDKKSQRYQDIQFIHNQSIKQLKKRRLFDISQFKFFVGDMNFSLLELKNQYIRQILSKISSIDPEKLQTGQFRRLLHPLLQKDQKCRTVTGYLNSYQQGQILFLPTYKFDFKLKSYDSKKTPAWYDRILYKSSDMKKIGIIRYNDINVYLSDHKPVYGIFNILIKKQNQQRKDKYIEAYLYQK